MFAWLNELEPPERTTPGATMIAEAESEKVPA